METPFHRLMDAGLVDQPIFAFYLGDLINDDPVTLGYAGELTLGGTDSKYASALDAAFATSSYYVLSPYFVWFISRHLSPTLLCG